MELSGTQSLTMSMIEYLELVTDWDKYDEKMVEHVLYDIYAQQKRSRTHFFAPYCTCWECTSRDCPTSDLERMAIAHSEGYSREIPNNVREAMDTYKQLGTMKRIVQAYSKKSSE